MAAYSYKNVFYRDDFQRVQKAMEDSGEWDDADPCGYDGSGWYAAATLLERKDEALAQREAEMEALQAKYENLTVFSLNLQEDYAALEARYTAEILRRSNPGA